MSDLKAKLQGMIKRPQLSVFATVTEDGKPWARYVMTVGDDDLTVRFTTFIKSRKVSQIEKNPEVHLTLGVASLETAEHYVQVQGKATVRTDKEIRHALWNDMLKRYFQGPDDPSYAVVEIKPYRIEYMSMTAMEPEIWES